MIIKFWHVSLSVKNLEEAIPDYKELGFKVEERFDMKEPRAFAAMLKHKNGSGLEIWQWVDKDHPQVEFIKNHTAFISDDQDSDVQKLVGEGWRIVIPKTTWDSVTYVFLRDPSGNYVEIADAKE